MAGKAAGPNCSSLGYTTMRSLGRTSRTKTAEVSVYKLWMQVPVDRGIGSWQEQSSRLGLATKRNPHQRVEQDGRVIPSRGPEGAVRQQGDRGDCRSDAPPSPTAPR
jgi:hypothetical protein